MDHEIIKQMGEIFEKSDLDPKEVSQIFRVCAELMGCTLVVGDDKTNGKLRSKFEIEQKYEELNQRMKNADMFSSTSIDGQRFILEWVLGQHGQTELKKESEILKKFIKNYDGVNKK